jgi:RimJ/RimL family protein N-acetyltransferase
MERPDSAALFHWLNDPAVMLWWGFGEAVVSRARIDEEIEGWLRDERDRGRTVAFMIEDLDHEPVGFAVLREDRAQDRVAELSLLIGEPERWGRGLGSDALDALVDASFAQWGLHRLTAKSEADNERAHRWLRRAGFRCEGTLREASFYDGAFHDQLLFGLLATDRMDDK